jgi:hypothetical protein
MPSWRNGMSAQRPAAPKATIPSRRDRRSWVTVQRIARLGLCLRALAVFVTLQISGLGAVAGELGFSNGAHDCCADCPLESDDQDCPPGCANCHCAHGSGVLARAFESTLPETPDVGRAMPPVRYEFSAHLSSAALGVYRPPRPTAAA